VVTETTLNNGKSRLASREVISASIDLGKNLGKCRDKIGLCMQLN
jgi:hypothetical protein